MMSVRELQNWLFTTTTLFAVSTAVLALELNITNDGPAILDSRITFVARLEAGSHTNLRYVFRHDVPGVEHEHTVYNDTTAVLALVFESGKSSSGLYTMEVTVFKDSFFTIRKVAYGKSPFTLTRDIVGRIIVSQNNETLADSEKVLSTNRTTNFTFELHDPSEYFKGSTISLSWKVDYSMSHYGQFLEYNFTDTQEHTIYLVVVALVPRLNTSQAVKIGSFERDITPKDPITSVSVEGNTWLRHGDVVSLLVSCNGSSPYHYCWKYYPGNTTTNSTANLTCDEPISTNMCKFPLVHYFPHDGSHLIAIVLTNIVQKKPFVKNIEVHIYDVPPKGLLSTIILPITCSLLAIVIMVTGVAYHIHTRNKLHVEVADFDFQRADLELMERSFWEHLLVAWKGAFPSCVSKRNSKHSGKEDDEEEEEEEDEDPVQSLTNDDKPSGKIDTDAGTVVDPAVLVAEERSSAS